MQNIFFLVLVAFIVWVIAAGNSVDPAPISVVAQTGSVPAPISTPTPILAPAPASTFINPTANFSCDGRQYCSQMNSREEALFFIRNCPNTKMDGDNDGRPCEGDSRF